jgi:cytochrome c peroxidase
VEQALPDNACVVYRVCIAAYPVTFEDVWGAGACAIAWPGNINAVCAMEGSTVVLSPSDRNMVDIDYDNIALSIAAFEGSSESNAFTSKFDLYLAGLVDLTPQEKKGYNLFKSKGKCDKCHVLEPGPGGEPPLFTDFNFENLGVPRNPQNPFYTQPGNPDGFDWVDLGLGGFLDTRPDTMAFASENYGKQKTPTLRNVDKRPVPGFVKAYAHNGYFKTLEGLVNFYNTRDVKPVCADRFTTEADALAQGCWPEPEVAANVNTSELGDLHLTASQEAAIVAFLRTLSDGYTP